MENHSTITQEAVSLNTDLARKSQIGKKLQLIRT